MMSIDVIRKENDRAAARARKAKKVPHVFTDPITSDDEIRLIPNLGSLVPPGWELIEGDELFVDHSGWGAPNEPALTLDQFKAELNRRIREDATIGYAIVEVGPFQLYIGTFKRKGKRARKN